VRRIFSKNLNSKDDEILIQDQEFFHLKVLRPKIGDLVEIVNGQGLIISGKIEEINKDSVLILKIKLKNYDKSSRTIGFAYPVSRIKNFEEVIEPLSELNVDVIYPYSSERSLRSGELTKNMFDRWQQKIISSLKQCKRPFMMNIQPLLTWEKLLNEINQYDVTFYGDLRSDHSFFSSLNSEKNGDTQKYLGIIGPEGDFSEKELKELNDSVAIGVSLGHNVLKVNTAAITMAAYLSAFS